MIKPRATPQQKALLALLVDGDRIAFDGDIKRYFVAETGKTLSTRTVDAARRNGFLDARNACSLFRDGGGEITDAGRATIR